MSETNLYLDELVRAFHVREVVLVLRLFVQFEAGVYVFVVPIDVVYVIILLVGRILVQDIDGQLLDILDQLKIEGVLLGQLLLGKYDIFGNEEDACSVPESVVLL